MKILIFVGGVFVGWTLSAFMTEEQRRSVQSRVRAVKRSPNAQRLSDAAHTVTGSVADAAVSVTETVADRVASKVDEVNPNNAVVTDTGV